MSYTLYSYFRSSCSWRVRIALALKGLEGDLKPVHLVKDGGEQHTTAYRSKNPMGQLPTFVSGNLSIGQSVAVIEFLEEAYPNPPLLPKDLASRAQVREMVQVINSGIQPIQNLSVMQALQGQFNLDKSAAIGWSKHWIEKGFDALETLAAKHPTPFMSGAEVTMADVFLVPQVYNARRFSVDMTSYPTLARIDEALLQLPAFEATHPSRQPDTPTDL